MNIDILNSFLIVAREENITKAAQLLHITQPTLSRQLMQLEEELTVKLFQRGKHSIHLTEEGFIFRRRAQELVNLAERAKKEVLQADDELTGEIAVGCNESQSMNELSKMIRDFRSTHTLVKFILRSGSNNEIREWLEQGSIDIGLLVEPVEIEKFSYARLNQKDQWGVLVHENDRLASKRVIHSDDLIGVPLITIIDETIHSELSSWSGRNADMMIPIVHYNLLSNAATLVRGQEGVAVCSKPWYEYPDLKFIAFEPVLELGAVLAWKAHQKFSRASTVFVEYIKQYGESCNNMEGCP